MQRLIAILGAAMLLATSCAPATTGPSESGEPSASEKPVPGGRVVIGATGDPKTMQPVIATDTQSSAVWNKLYLGLLTREPKTGAIVGGLAEKYELSKDGLTLVYTLRNNLVWSDGTPFTGDDYKYTAEAVMRSKKTVRKSTFDNVAGAKDYADGKTDGISGIVVGGGGKTITITFTKVYCPAIEDLSGAGAGGILPSAAFKKVWDNKTTDATKNIDDNDLNMNPPASMGAWIFKEFKPGDRVTFTKNPKYYKGEPLLDELVIKTYADATAIKAALLIGEVTFAGVQPKDYDEVKAVAALRGIEYANFGWDYIGWNAEAAKAPWLTNKQVRQALMYGLNRQAILDKVLFGHGKLVNASQPPANAAFDDSDLNKYPFDVAKAKQLLEQAGAKMGTDGLYRWTDGSKMKMRIETNQGNNVRETIVAFSQEQYKAIGIEIEPLLESFNALLDRTKCCGTDYEGFVLGWVGLGPDPDHKDLWHSSAVAPSQFNRPRYRNPIVDQALDAGRDGPDCSDAARKTQAHIVDKALNEDVPVAFLYSQDSLVFASRQLQAFDPTQYSTYWNVEKWWIKK
jgi:peptide/nickel transport system substrate-binding protein